MTDSKENERSGEKTLAEATVLTPPLASDVTVPHTDATPHTSTAFKGGLGTGGMEASFSTSIKTQDLLGDKLILSAPRADYNGKQVPVLGGIQLLAKLGQGGMGAVYFGVHPRLHQEVAVKVLPFHLAEQQPGLIPRFIREAQIAAKVRSPHLVGVIDVNEENGLFYLVMEYVSGKSAGDYLRDITTLGSKGLPEKTALAICIGATEGLAAAHAHGVIHRDIKPDNIMIPRGFISGTGADATAKTLKPEDAPYDFADSKLADLGLARNETGDQSMTAVNSCMGTPGFMSPEQARDAKHASKPADVFSLGATLYALLSGDSPFKGSSLMETLNLTVNEPHPPITTVRPDVTANTSALLDRCLAKNKEERYADATELLGSLRLCYESLDGKHPHDTAQIAPKTSLDHPHPSPKAVKPAESQPEKSSLNLTVVLAVAGVAFAILAGGGYFLWQKLTRDEKAALAIIAKERDEIAERERKEAEKKLDDMRDAAFQEELRMLESWRANQRNAASENRLQTLAEMIKFATQYKKNRDFVKALSTLDDVLKNISDAPPPIRDTVNKLLNDVKEERTQALNAFAASLQMASDANREQNWDKTIQILEDAFKILGVQPPSDRIAAGEFMLKNAREQKRLAVEAFSAAYKAAQNFKRDKNSERLISTLDSALKTLGAQSHADRAAAETLLKDAKDERDRLNRKDTVALDSLPAALIAAQEYKRAHNWDGVVLALEEPLKAVGAQQHPNRAAVEALLKEAKEQKERLRLFKIEIDKGNDFVKAQNYDAAKTAFEGARKMAQETAETTSVTDGLKRAADGAKRVKSTQARLLMNQGKSLRPDTNKGVRGTDWAKAGEAFKGAAAIYQEIDDRLELARAEVEQADCLRKDNNKAGDWTQAAGLYEAAALRFNTFGERKSQAEAVAKHAQCLDPDLNPAGSTRLAAPLFGRAAMLFGEAGNKRAMADNLSRQGNCISKEKNNTTSAERAADAFRRAAVVYEELGEKKAQGLCVFNQAACLIKGKKTNMNAEARGLFTRAMKLCREAGDEATAKMAEDLLK